ncbi:membrane protein [Mycolicibacterium aubagnense]|uniref:Membrane protein n=1 Tax=Mycolicibacterium aubagnense TaxID=319707 RepID=A0ABM7ICY9_9MYCO|nr:membrane protein [Mycolicibacterium aubagnense]
MPAHRQPDNHPAVTALIWSGGVLAWLVAAAVAAPSTGLPLAVILPATLIFGVLVVVAIRSTVASARGTVGRVALAVAIGLLVGELAAMTLFSNAISQRMDSEAAARAAGTPAVTAAQEQLNVLRASRGTLDAAVDSARQRRDDAQVVARCEYHPTPACAQQPITGVPGDGQITQNTQDTLEHDQRELDAALATRTEQAPALDARIAGAEHAVTAARDAAGVGADRGFGARWVAMNGYTIETPAALVARIAVIGVCVLLYLLPMLLHARQDRTLRERHNESRLKAELRAETAIAVKQAEVRAEAEILKAEHQLAAMRLALETDAEINREYHRQRVASLNPEALTGGSTQPALAAPTAEALRPSTAQPQPMYSDWDELMSFPGPQQRSLSAAPPAPETDSAPAEPIVTADLVPIGGEAAANLPAPATSQPAGGLTLPQLPDLTKVAARLLRPLMAPVAPVVDRVIDTSVQQLRSAQKVIEEFEEITFTLRRTSRTTVSDSAHEQSSGPRGADQSQALGQGQGGQPPAEPRWAAPQMNATFAPIAPPRGVDHTALSSSDTTIIDAADERRQLGEGRRAIEP